MTEECGVRVGRGLPKTFEATEDGAGDERTRAGRRRGMVVRRDEDEEVNLIIAWVLEMLVVVLKCVELKAVATIRWRWSVRENV